MRSFGALGRNVGRQAFADLGFNNPRVVQNLSVAELYEKAIQMAPLRVPSQRETISSSGALIAYSDKCTGRSPKEKRVVVEETSKDHIWWGDVEDPKKSPNMPLSEKSYLINRNRAVSYLNTVPQIFIVDGYASWDERYKITCRIICSKAYHALFMRNMLIRPTPE
jgi:phosphoenolpyruvate carboxykinase (ATP)